LFTDWEREIERLASQIGGLLSEGASVGSTPAGETSGGLAEKSFPQGPCPQSQGNPVTFISYPKTSHDFDVQGGYSGVVKEAQVSPNATWWST
jgi:hypothetical protein